MQETDLDEAAVGAPAAAPAGGAFGAGAAATGAFALKSGLQVGTNATPAAGNIRFAAGMVDAGAGVGGVMPGLRLQGGGDPRRQQSSPVRRNTSFYDRQTQHRKTSLTDADGRQSEYSVRRRSQRRWSEHQHPDHVDNEVHGGRIATAMAKLAQMVVDAPMTTVRGAQPRSRFCCCCCFYWSPIFL